MKSSRNAQLQSPRLPAEMVPGAVRTLEDGAEYVAMVMEDCDFRGQSAESVVFDGVLFQHSSLNRSRLVRTRISDTKLEASDLSETIWQKARWNRVEFIGCRLTGIQLPEFNGQDVLFKGCPMEGAMFTTGRFRSVRFERCNLRSSLFEKMDLTGTTFSGCDLTGADLLGSTLKGVDFRGSGLVDMRVEGRQLQGTIIDPLQSIQVASLLGISVRESGE
jgi:uncharacterized protein YjbI with pentapeptide repeats